MKQKCLVFIVLLYILFGLPFEQNAQDSIAADAFLQQQLEQIDTDIQITLPSKNFKPAFFRQIEIRTETDEFIWKEQQYQLRFSPRRAKTRRIEQQLYALYQMEAELDLSDEKEEIILQVHENWLRAYAAHQELMIVEQQYQLLLEETNLIEQLIAANRLDASKWMEQQNRLFDLETERGSIQSTLAQKTDNQSIDWKNQLSLKDLTTKLLSFNLTQISAYDNKIAQDLALQEMALERSEDHQWLDFINFDYNRSPNDLLREEFSIGAAFILPWRGNSRLKRAELTIEQETLATKARVRSQTTERFLKQQQAMIISDYDNWKTQQNRLQAFEKRMQDFLQQLRQSEEANPLLPFTLQQQLLEQQIDLLKLEMDIRERYLAFLEESGMLFE